MGQTRIGLFSGVTLSLRPPQITSSAVVSLLSKSHPAVSFSQKRWARTKLWVQTYMKLLTASFISHSNLSFTPVPPFDVCILPIFLFVCLFVPSHSLHSVFCFHRSRWWQRELFLLPALHRCVTSWVVQSHASRHLSEVGFLFTCSVLLLSRSQIRVGWWVKRLPFNKKATVSKCLLERQ